MLDAQLLQQNFDDKQPKVSPDKNGQPIIVALMTVMFALPFCTGNALLHYIFILFFFLFFSAYVFLHTKKYQFSLFRQLKRSNKPAYYLMLAFGLSSLVSYLNIVLGESDQFRKFMASSRYIIYLTTFFYVFALARLSLVSRFRVGNVFLALMVGNVLLAISFILISYFSGATHNLDWNIDPPFGRHVRLITMGVEVAVIVCVTLFLLGKNSRVFSVFLWFCMLVSSAFLVSTGSRASMIFTLIVMFLLVCLGVIYRQTNYLKVGMVIFCVGLAVLFADKLSIPSWNGLQRAIEVSSVNVTATTPGEQSVYEITDKLSSGRLVIWSAVFHALRESPWFGLGPNASFFVIKAPHAMDQPHNFILQFLIEWGIVGAVLLLALLAGFAWQGMKNIPRAMQEGDTDYILAAAVILILTLNGLTDGTYYHIQPIVCIATAFAVFPFFPIRGKAPFGKKA